MDRPPPPPKGASPAIRRIWEEHRALVAAAGSYRAGHFLAFENMVRAKEIVEALHKSVAKGGPGGPAYTSASSRYAAALAAFKVAPLVAPTHVEAGAAAADGSPWGLPWVPMPAAEIARIRETLGAAGADFFRPLKLEF